MLECSRGLKVDTEEYVVETYDRGYKVDDTRPLGCPWVKDC